MSFTPLGQMYGAIGPSLDIGDLLVGMVDNVGSTLFYVLTFSSFLRIDRKATVTWDRTRDSSDNMNLVKIMLKRFDEC